MAGRLLELLATVVLSNTVLAATPSAPIQTYLEAPGPAGALKGTMLAPASGAAPIMLIIPGSGPTDRDGNNPLGVKADVQIAGGGAGGEWHRHGSHRQARYVCQPRRGRRR